MLYVCVCVHIFEFIVSLQTWMCSLSEAHLQGSQTARLEVEAGRVVGVQLKSNSLNSTQCCWKQSCV